MPEPQSKNIVVQAHKLTKQFGSFTAVDAISFEVTAGEIFGFLGANGAGKTTAIRMLTGLLRPSGGQAQVAGLDVFTQSAMIKRRIGYMSQRFSLYEDLTVFENMRFYGAIYGIPRQDLNNKIDTTLAGLDLTSSRNTLLSALPLGWKQRLAFSTALIHEPAVVFLDEPTGGVDPITRRQFWEMIYAQAERGTTIFVTTHYMDEAEYCDRVSIMVDGNIAALDTPQGLKQSFKAKTMDDVFVQLVRGPQTTKMAAEA